MIIDTVLTYWYPELDVGTKVNLTIHDGERSFEKEVEIVAIGNYRGGLQNYSYFNMAKEAVDALSDYNSSGYFHVIADEKYDAALAQSLEELVLSSGTLKMRTWQQQYVYWKTTMAMVGGAGCVFLGILGAISVMNLVNTMVHSLHARRKEIGMMQAVGMTNRQLILMLQMEGLFYTLGTLIVSVGLGSILGYPVFLWAKENGMFNISQYHYPLAAAVLVTAVMVVVQMILALARGSSVRNESLF